jgi:hypothetical protein
MQNSVLNYFRFILLEVITLDNNFKRQTVSNKKDKFKQLAQETLQILTRGNYRTSSGTMLIGNLVLNSVSHSKLYRPNHAFSLSESESLTTSIEVTPETTLQAAHRLLQSGSKDVAVLNFASAKHPVGVFCQEVWHRRSL